MSIIELKNVSKTYQTKQKQVTAVNQVNLTIEKGEIFGIIGYSGAGKSSLIRLLNNLESPTSGEVVINFDLSMGEPEKEFAEEYCKKDNDLTAKMYEALSDGVEPKTDLIDKQDHYTNNGIQPIQIMKANMTKEKYRGFLEGNILKYPLRYEDKNGLEDLKKAKTYLTWLIEDIEERGL